MYLSESCSLLDHTTIEAQQELHIRITNNYNAKFATTQIKTANAVDIFILYSSCFSSIPIQGNSKNYTLIGLPVKLHRPRYIKVQQRELLSSNRDEVVVHILGFLHPLKKFPEI